MAAPLSFIDYIALRDELDAMLVLQQGLRDLCRLAVDAAQSEQLQAISNDLRQMTDELSLKLAELDARFPRTSAH